MNNKSIIVGSLALGLLIGGALFSISTKVENTYTPRTIENGGLKGQAGYAEYLHNLKADPTTGEIDYSLVQQVKSEILARAKKNNKALLGLNWTQMGPDNVGGRTRAIVVDRNNSNTVYAGSVSGGLFVSYDGSLTWQPITSMDGIAGENLSISCITQTNNGKIYFGTGSGFEGAGGNGGSGFIGNGVYQYDPSTGQISPVITNSTTPPNNISGSAWSFMNAIASFGNRLYIGTKQGLFFADPDGSGNYPNDLNLWTKPIAETATVQDIDIATDGSMLVCFSNNKIFTSDQSDVTFTQRIVSGSRKSGAIAPSNPNVFYLLKTAGSVLGGIEISLDKGQTWSEIIPGGATVSTYCLDPFRQNTCGFQNSQGVYDQCIAVDPSDWGHIIVGGVQLFEWQYNPGSNPIGGSWFKSANLFESTSNPFYVHADKHTIVWPATNSVYIGCDGGVFKSTDGGETWKERNLGYNVTQFYDMDVNPAGWMIGGTQDNGSQLFANGMFGTPSPLGTFEVTGGDGFDACFSNQGPGMVFTTIYSGAIFRAAGGVPGSFVPPNTGSSAFHTVISNWESNEDPLSVDSVTVVVDSNSINGIVTINPKDNSKPRPLAIFPGDSLITGDTINFESFSNATPLQYIYTGSSLLLPIPDSLTAPFSLKIQDPIQNKFVAKMDDGIYFTRDAARLNDLNPEWFRISNFTSVENFEFSPDGNHLFVGTNNGQCWRISGLSQANDSTLNFDDPFSIITVTQISGISGGGYVGMAIDPNDGNNLIITTSGYSTSNHVYRCTNALSGGPTAVAIQGAINPLPKMPVYDACIDMNNKDRVILGTEWGVWTSDNAFSATAATVDWTDESGNGMTHVPVFAVEQQTNFGSFNTGYIYLGTHGRGFYMSSDLYTSVDEFDEFADSNKDKFVSDLNVYPNPISGNGTIDFDLYKSSNNSVVRIYNLSGALVKTIDLGNQTIGNHKVRFNVSDLSIGTYILSLDIENERKIAKFVVNK